MQKITKENESLIIKYFKENKILIMLTDTVYGIMALATKKNEIKINKLKKSNIDKKISIIFPNKEVLFKYLKNIDKEKEKIINQKLPGKYTLILNLKDFSNFKRDDFGIRITTNKYLQNIIEQVGPILATSCNISKEKICKNTEEIEEVFKNEDVILVMDKEANNKASTIIDLTNDIKIIRK